MNYLILGGSGYIGGRLVQKLKETSHHYLSVDSQPSKDSNSRVLDLRNENELRELVEGFQPDIIIHCATYSAQAYADNYDKCMQEDTDVTTSLLKVIGSRRLVYFSSTYTLSGLPSDVIVTETTELSPTHPFGKAKAHFEKYILQQHPNTVIFRLSSVFGEGNYAHANAIVNMAKECESGSLHVWGTGTRKMQYIWIDDALQFILAADKIPEGLYNLGGDEYLSTADTAALIAKHYNANVAFLEEKIEGATLPFMSTEKLKKATQLSFTPTTDAIALYLDALKQKSI